MRLSGRCCKCGSDCTPRWHKATDRMRYICMCGYEWSSAPLDASPPDLSMIPAEIRRRIHDAQRSMGGAIKDEQPLKVMLTNGTGRGEINFQ